MIGTHAPKTLNSRLKQAAICADIIGYIPSYFICSKTIKGQKYWALPLNAAKMPETKAQLAKLEADNATPEIALPELTDAHIKQLLLLFKGKQDYVSVTPVPSCKTLSEVWRRLRDDGKAHYAHWVIQPTPAAMANHGQMLAEQFGRVRLFTKTVKNPHYKSTWIRTGTFVEFDIEAQGLNIAAGMVSTGFPAITAIGGLAHALERETNQLIQFAVGIKSNEQKNSTEKTIKLVGKKITPVLVTDEIKGNAHLVILFKCRNLEAVAEALKKVNRVAGGIIVSSKITIKRSEKPVMASFLNEVNKNYIAGTISKSVEETKDGLDIAVKLYNYKNSYYTILQSGYALLEEPNIKERSRRGKHAWAEPMFSIVVLSPFSRKSWWKMDKNKDYVAWTNPLTDD